MQILKYDPSRKDEWNSFVREGRSRNATFLLDRDYMDYHSERFDDHSLMFGDKGRIVALFPANRADDCLESHGGLTYGGFLLGRNLGVSSTLEAFETLIQHCQREGFSSILYKTVPFIYWNAPADDDRYALFCNDAVLYRRDVLSVIDLETPLDFQERRKRGAKRAVEQSVTVGESDDWSGFWKILVETLGARHGVRPTHELGEMTLLRQHFPEQIRLFLAIQDSVPVAGTVLYLTGQVAHAQYIAANTLGRELGALDLLFRWLTEPQRLTQRYFDFGVSTEANGRELNSGLAYFKEGFGARTVVQDFYRMAI